MGDKRQPPRSTQKLESEQLSKLARESVGSAAAIEKEAGEGDWSDVEMAVGSQANVAPLYARTTTVSDPMTMALLAEVARNSRTIEIDPSKIEEAHALADELDEGDKPDVVHPHLKRR